MKKQGREEDWTLLVADEGAAYDIQEELNLAEIEPLIAKPSSPGNVVPAKELAGEPIYQSYIGSSANPGFVASMRLSRRDIWDCGSPWPKILPASTGKI